MKTLLLIIAIAAAILFVIAHFGGRIGKKIVLYTVLILIALIMLMPFYMMFVMSTLSTNQIYTFPPYVWFGDNLLTNLKNMSAAVNFFRSFGNSLLVTGSYTVLSLFFCSIGGYAFSVYNFPGRDKLFAILLATMMIPAMASIIPWFVMMSKFGWINDYKALVIPGAATAFGIFWMRQYCQNNVPTALMEAARIDGCSEWTIFFRVVAPILKPAYASLGIMNFVNMWNEFMQALIILRKDSLYTLPLMLRSMVSDRGTDYGAVMVASTCATLPLLIAFLSASKFFMDGLTAGAVKE